MNEAKIHHTLEPAAKTVHLYEQLVECRLPLVIPLHVAPTTSTCDTVDFINEDDARLVLFCLIDG